jgi:hypothetical protein
LALLPKTLTEDTIIKLFEESAAAGCIQGNTIEAIAIIYEHSPQGRFGEPVAMPPKRQLAQMFIDSHKQAGLIDHTVSLSSNALVEMRKLKSGESKEIKSINDSLASILGEQLLGKELSNYAAISLNGDTVAFGMVWFAVAVEYSSHDSTMGGRN